MSSRKALGEWGYGGKRCNFKQSVVQEDLTKQITFDPSGDRDLGGEGDPDILNVLWELTQVGKRA